MEHPDSPQSNEGGREGGTDEWWCAAMKVISQLICRNVTFLKKQADFIKKAEILSKLLDFV